MIHRAHSYKLLLQLKLTASILLCMVLGKSYAFVLFDQLPVLENTAWVDTASKPTSVTYSAVYSTIQFASTKATTFHFYQAYTRSDDTLLQGKSHHFSLSTGLSYPTPSDLQLIEWLYRKMYPLLSIIAS